MRMDFSTSAEPCRVLRSKWFFCSSASQALGEMARPNLLDCCLKISSLQDKLKHLQERFGFSTMTAVIHGAQIDLQQVRG